MLKFLSPFVFLCFLSGCSFNGIFFPVDQRPDEQIDTYKEAIELKAQDGTLINHFLFKPTREHKATIFVFQGSGSKVVNWYKVIKPLIKDGYQVFMMDYRGFGESKGVASHTLVAQDASNAIQYLKNRADVAEKPLLVLGQSYGGQLAIYVTQKHPDLIDALVTEGTFTSFSDEAAYSSPWIVRPLVKAIFSQPYQSKLLISEVNVPLLIIHSTDDKVVPFDMAKTLYANAKGNKQLWQTTGKHVAALIDEPERYVSKVNELLKEQ